MIRRIYHWLIPKKVQRILLSLISSLGFAKKLGILICKDYIPVSIHNVKIVGDSQNDMKPYILIEENASPTICPIHLEEQQLEAMQPLVARTETVVLELDGESYFFSDRHLFDHKMNVIDECGLRFEKMPIYRKLLSRNRVKVKGTVAYLSNVEPSNYYHWMCRTLPLIRIYKKFFDLQEIDFFYIGQTPILGFQQESLLKAGIRMDQVIQQACTSDQIIAAISSRVSRFGSAPIHWENFIFSRNLFSREIESNAGIAKKRLYVSRGNAKRRKVINELEVINLLKNYGFEFVTMDGKTLQQQVELFSQAEAVVAPHGAALTNLLFVQPGTTVIELIPYGYVNNCFYVLASYADTRYFYLQGEKLEQPGVDQHSLDLSVDIDKLDRICQMAFKQMVLR